MKEEEDYKEFVNAVADNEIDRLIREDIAPFTCQLLQKDADENLKPYASGVFVFLEDAYYLLTAGHVIDDWDEKHPLLISVKDGHIWLAGKGFMTNYLTGNHIDVGCVRILDVQIELLKANYHFLTIDKMLVSNLSTSWSNYCLYGYPEKDYKMAGDWLAPTAAVYFARPLSSKVFDYYQLSTDTHFVLEARGDGFDLHTAAFKKVNIEPNGVSGGGLWYISYRQNANHYTAEARLIGIMTAFRRGRYQCLLANRLELALSCIRDYPEHFQFP
jgi:hypothetical protein